MMYTDEIIVGLLTKVVNKLDSIERALDLSPSVGLIQPAKSLGAPVSGCAIPEHKLLNEKQASEITGLSLSWFRQSRMRGSGPPYIKVGRAVRYRLQDLQGWLANNTVGLPESHRGSRRR